MIDLTIKTLDSQNHAFSVEDDVTVAQFKEKVAEVINIPVDSQRLIYCGRVLQDTKKLQEYDVNGKVVHLVQRAPPSATRRSRSPQPDGGTPRTRRAFIPGFNGSANAMYLGSMAFPSGLMEAQGIVPPPPTQSLSGSRLNVARRMLRRAECILNNLEDPQGTRTRESPPEEPQDEVTPVFAAQVFVPHSHNEDPLASLSAAVSAVENGILQGEQPQPQPQPQPSPSQPQPQPTSSQAATEATPDEPATQQTSSTDPAQPQPDPNRPGRLPENSSGTIEMSRLLDDLNKVQERFRPFMERYHTFMRNDPTIESEQGPDSIRQTQTLVNRVSEIMHLLGHAYHSLSDVMVSVSTPPPRPLLCRPILIQHSAVLQAGIPIQVEAQINLTPERRSTENTTNASAQSETSQATTESTNTTTSASTPSAPSANTASAHLRPSLHEIRIDSFPIEFRNYPRPSFSIQQQRSQPNASSQQLANNANGAQAAPTSATETNNTAQPTPRPNEPNVVVMPPFVNNINPNMEFFMEVTPESITIDSLETTVVTSAAQADNVLRGTFGSTPPDFIQSILQAVAGQMMGGGGVGSGPDTPTAGGQSQASTGAAAAAASSTATAASTGAASAAAAAAAAAANVNSQARGNTQTHPTTATQTRSTSRPHVHLAQHTMQGFDPFLPCNSHHIRHRRRTPHTHTTTDNTSTTTTTTTPNTNTTTTTTTNNAAELQNNNHAPNPLYNVLQVVDELLIGIMGFQGLLRSLNNINRHRGDRPQEAASGAAAPATSASEPLPPFATLLNPTMDFADLSRLLFDTTRNTAQGTTLASFLSHFPDHQHTDGESLFTDLIMTLARGLTFSDVIALNTGHIDPLVRLRPTLRTFFRNRVLEGECPNQAAIDRGANRLIEELQPFLELLSTMRVRDNIDVVQSARQVCRARFPCIISLVMSRTPGSLRTLVDQCLHTVHDMCSLTLHCCLDGQHGLEQLFTQLVSRYTVGVTPDIRDWTVNTSVAQLRQFLSTISVSLPAIQPYIVVRSPTEQPEPGATATVADKPESEASQQSLEMECENIDMEPTTESATAMSLNSEPMLDGETLPNVVIGSETWHRGLSADWIPIITRDAQRQRRQNPQAPFSDAYLSGMPSKRRKIVAASKPQGNLSQVISEGVKRAVSAAGVAVADGSSVEAVAAAASAEPGLQAAYRDMLRSSVHTHLTHNPDFTPERFPNADNYFNFK